jgi:hypothetical protein
MMGFRAAFDDDANFPRSVADVDPGDLRGLREG